MAAGAITYEEYDKITNIYGYMCSYWTKYCKYTHLLVNCNKNLFQCIFLIITPQKNKWKRYINILLHHFSHLSGLIVSQILAILKTQV